MIKVTLNQEKLDLFDYISSTKNHIFITGKAGTGKSTLLEHLRSNSDKNTIVCAPTGIAAINVGGQTIHSLFRLPFNYIKLENLKIDYKALKVLRELDMLIVDEISMVRADVLDAMDYLLRRAKKEEHLPFGGVQIVAFGDMYQLPPVVTDEDIFEYTNDGYSGFYFFHAKVWNEAHLDVRELQEIFRQKDEDFKNILNKIRTGHIDTSVLQKINTRTSGTVPPGAVVLATTNATVSYLNQQKLTSLDEKEFIYKAAVTGEFSSSEYPTEETLTLKVGAQIMMLKNDSEHRWANGTIGRIFSLSKDEIKVFIDKQTYTVKAETWSKIRYNLNETTNKIEEEVVASFTQFPLRLAWAITIHKSQGQTYEKVCIDLGRGAFAHGQTYVALSRATSLDGLFLARPLRASDIIVDPVIVGFMQKIDKKISFEPIPQPEPIEDIY